MGGEMSSYRILVEKPEGSRVLESPSIKERTKFKPILRNRMSVCVDWAHLSQDKDQ
jgi:hypothetical protein